MKRLVLLAVVVIILGAAAFWWVTEPRPAFSREEWQAYEAGGDADRGRRVFFAGGCASCHATPGQKDRLKLGGGLELKSPFGSFFVPNISPHPTDGIGAWKVVDLANAMLSGVSPEGAHYYPAFPYTSFHHATLDDVRDLMAFLRTLAPVEGKARPHALGFPFNIRRFLGAWKLLFFDHSPFAPEPSKSPEWIRGRYLVEGLAHCAECHSPRNFLGGIIAGERFSGGMDIEGKGRVPNITPDPTGIATWSKEDIAALLMAGVTPTFDAVGSSMADVVRNTAELPDSDREAMAEYIKTLPPRPSSARRAAQ